MIQETLNSIWRWFSHNSHPLTIIRTVAFFMFFLLITLGWLRARRKSKRTSQEEEMQMIIQKYQKNEEGEYPWETDTDDDPRSIKEDAKIVNLDALPKRGRWKT